MKKIMIISTLSFFLFLGVSCGNKTTKTDAQVETQELATGDYYTCPMHPEIHEDKPGDCPKCGMALELKEVANVDSMEMHMNMDSVKKIN